MVFSHLWLAGLQRHANVFAAQERPGKDVFQVRGCVDINHSEQPTANDASKVFLINNSHQDTHTHSAFSFFLAIPVGIW